MVYKNLYLVPVPIGNLQDITLRAIEILKMVDFIIAEDTRHSKKLLSHLGISKRIISYYKHKELEKSHAILKELKRSNGALITDSGTPLVSDPGFILVNRAASAGVNIIPLPGPNAVLPALTASGLPTDRFLFLGFPPRKTSELKKLLSEVKSLSYTLIFYESPRRVTAFLNCASEVLGNRQFAIAKEISKKNERIIRGSLADVQNSLKSEILLGEMVVVLEGADKKAKKQKSGNFETLQDIFDYFKENYNLSRNDIKRILMKK